MPPKFLVRPPTDADRTPGLIRFGEGVSDCDHFDQFLPYRVIISAAAQH